MNTNILKSGNVKLTIVIFFVLAIMGGLGFVFWNNFAKQSTVDKSSGTVVKNPLKTLFVKEWGVSLSYKNLTNLSYSIIDNGDSQDLSFVSSATADCDSTGLGGITRSSAASIIDNKVAKSINDYAYSYRPPTFINCDDINSSAVQDLVNNIRDIYLTLSPYK